ncbi:MAG: endoglucanase, partial [Prevotella sp.]|nr:endoglucanase [Prevotella sp.]
MMKKLRYLLWLVFILLSSVPIQSCSDDDKTPSATKLEVLKNNTPIESLDFQIPASSMMIGINCDADWTATV